MVCFDRYTPPSQTGDRGPGDARVPQAGRRRPVQCGGAGTSVPRVRRQAAGRGAAGAGAGAPPAAGAVRPRGRTGHGGRRTGLTEASVPRHRRARCQARRAWPSTTARPAGGCAGATAVAARAPRANEVRGQVRPSAAGRVLVAGQCRDGRQVRAQRAHRRGVQPAGRCPRRRAGSSRRRAGCTGRTRRGPAPGPAPRRAARRGSRGSSAPAARRPAGPT